jgi:hypothetical protein
MLRTGTIAMAVSAAAFLMGGASANAAAEAPPANDNLASAIVLGGRSGIVGCSNAEATKEIGEPDHAGVPSGASIWYRWNSTLGGRVTRSWSARTAKGRVIRQRPASRTRLAPRSRVQLVVSKGRRR